MAQPLTAGLDATAGQVRVERVLDRGGDLLPQLPGHDHALRPPVRTEHHRRGGLTVMVEPGRDLVQSRASLVRRQHLSHTQNSTGISTESHGLGSSLAALPDHRQHLPLAHSTLVRTRRLETRAGTTRRLLAAVVGLLLAVLGLVVSAGPAAAQNRVGAHQPNLILTVGPHQAAGQENVGVRGPPLRQLVSAPGVAADTGGGQTLFHYTDEGGMKGILDSGELHPSLKSANPKDARYGDGQYLSDIQPGAKTCAQLSRCFLNQPFQGNRFTNYVEINVDGLQVVQGRANVFVVPGTEPLDLTGRIVSFGVN